VTFLRPASRRSPFKGTLLKKARQVISLSFLLLYFLLFTGFLNGMTAIKEVLRTAQIFPAALKIIGGDFAAVLGLGLILILTLLFGRFYCSSLCPLGTLQDLFIISSRKIFNRKDYRFHKEWNLFRYCILAFSVIMLVSGSLILINLIEPFSNFGRLTANLIRPPAAMFFNTMSLILLQFHIYFSSDIPIHSLEASVLILTISFFIGLFILSWLRGRLYCNTFCPTGALLSLFSRFSLWKLGFREEECTGCALCESVCKAECINSGERQLDSSRCIHCYNCLDACPRHALEFQFRFIRGKKGNVDKRRREFLSLFIKGSITAIILHFTSNVSRANAIMPFLPVKRKYPVIPPGSESIAHFTAYCTGCHLCAISCPTHVIKPTLIQFGLAGLFQPVMDYDSSFCNYECNACLKVCPTGAIKEYSLEEKKIIQIGFANLDKKKCIAYVQNKQCGICAEYCPTSAVYLVPYKKNLPAPVTDSEICIGCGACENACPARPEKAITVEGNPVHKRVAKREGKPPVNMKQESRDFPF